MSEADNEKTSRSGSPVARAEIRSGSGISGLLLVAENLGTLEVGAGGVVRGTYADVEDLGHDAEWLRGMFVLNLLYSRNLC